MAKGGAVTPSELLALVGRAWTRLLLYPGGLSMLVATWFAFSIVPALLNRKERKKRGEKENNFFALFAVIFSPISVAAPWLGVALMPLPGAVDLGRGIDIVIVLALLDVPLFQAIGQEIRSQDMRQSGIARLAAALNGYPALIFAVLLLASNGSLELGLLVQPPSSFPNAILHWAGAAGFVVALPPVIGLGPFTTCAEPSLRFGLQLRAVGLWVLAALPWMSPLQGQIWQVLPPLLLALLLRAFHRVTQRQTALVWARGYVAFTGLLLLILFGGTAWQVALRLQ